MKDHGEVELRLLMARVPGLPGAMRLGAMRRPGAFTAAIIAIALVLALALVAVAADTPADAPSDGSPSTGRPTGSPNPVASDPMNAAPDSVAASSRATRDESPDSSAAGTNALASTLIADSRDALKEGDYDRAARNLKKAISLSEGDADLLGQAYLAIVSTYVQRGNYYKNEPQGRETSELYYKEGGRYVGECLSRPELRHLRPVPASRYPPEMHEMFRRTREEMFGSLRVMVALPRDSRIVLDGDTLSAAPGDSAIEASDLAAGVHQLRIGRRGYRDLREDIHINAGSMTERVYRLTRSRSLLWYASRASLGVGGVVAYLVTRKEPGKESPPRPVDPGPDYPR